MLQRILSPLKSQIGFIATTDYYSVGADLASHRKIPNRLFHQSSVAEAVTFCPFGRENEDGIS